MNKLITLSSFILAKTSFVFASHQNSVEGGSSLPTHESMADNVLYVLLPFIGISMLLNELMQFYLERKYAGSSLKSAEGLMNYTITISLIVTGLSLFTRIFHSIPDLGTIAYTGILVVLFSSVLGLRFREEIQEKF